MAVIEDIELDDEIVFYEFWFMDVDFLEDVGFNFVLFFILVDFLDLAGVLVEVGCHLVLT